MGFPGLPEYLEPRFLQLKRDLVKEGNIEVVTESWKRLLVALEQETKSIQEEGSSRVPVFDWAEIVANDYQLTEEQSKIFKQRGTVLVKGVVDASQADRWFEELVDFIKENPETAGAYKGTAAMFNLFWTKPQAEARSHPEVERLVKVFGNQFYVEDKENSYIDLDTQVVYGDRIRIRQSGQEALLPLHLDSSSVERWEDLKFRSSYKEIFEGRWEEWDPWKLDDKQFAQEDLYKFDTTRSSKSICTSFRTLQGWLSLSDNEVGGTLRVLPSLKLAISYVLLRPFFWRDPESGNIEDYEIDLETTRFPGTKPGTGQIILDVEDFPHLNPSQNVVKIPEVNKGDFIFWHTDLPHDVDPEHHGSSHSSVFYYAIAPLSPGNIETLLDTKDSWTRNVSPFDYRHTQAPGTKENQGADIKNVQSDESKRSLGLLPFEIKDDLTLPQKKIRLVANEALKNGHFDLPKFLKEINSTE
ncbi:hypothetical protein CLIB1423_07S01948 [[Candida] railenensis]|uniref:DUF1479 domain protein n=1 Tax=[Candida] railenensis TaxID=45579 RepID=A0A9P0QPJ5_9ASCO|nr:hypothetical protein CLIB1423_07S01948 [[Candida] railenensis]